MNTKGSGERGVEKGVADNPGAVSYEGNAVFLLRMVEQTGIPFA